MAEVGKQRLVGILLVLLAITISAFFLVKNTNNHTGVQSEKIAPVFNSKIATVDDNIVVNALEILVDPHNLGDGVPLEVKGPTTDKPVIKASSIKSISVTLKKPALEKVKAPTVNIVKSLNEKVPIQKPKKANVNEPEWVIQLASFRVRGKAQALQVKVGTLGYKSYIQSIKNSEGKTFYRLRIGPQFNEKMVSSIVRKIKKHLKLTPQIIKM